MTRVGAIDCGTNSIRLLIADVDPATGSLTDVVRTLEIVRLGQGVDRTGMLDPAALERTLDVCRRYAATCRNAGVGAVRFVATSASRDARNAADFMAGVRAAFGDLHVTPEVISGDLEAQLSFTGATGSVAAAGIGGPYLAVDIGGGSTEFVRGTSTVAAARSINIGSVRITERHLRSDPPTAQEIGAAIRDIESALDVAEADVDFTGLGAVVGLGGSVTTLTAHALSLAAYDPAAIHLAQLGVDTHCAAASGMLGLSRAKRVALPFLHPGRVDVIGAGALVWRQVLQRVVQRSPGVQVVTSEHDILDGIALSLR